MFVWLLSTGLLYDLCADLFTCVFTCVSWFPSYIYYIYISFVLQCIGVCFSPLSLLLTQRPEKRKGQKILVDVVEAEIVRKDIALAASYSASRTRWSWSVVCSGPPWIHPSGVFDMK